MFVKIIKGQIVKRISSIQELREEFTHISFPPDEEFDNKVKLPTTWYFENSKEANALLG